MDESSNLQNAVFDFLGNPATHGGCEVRRIDTHAAAVFLAGDRALKVKRAVRFAFLDYSTLAKRKAACLAELQVNRAFAPQLYRRIVAITREPGGRLAIGGGGEPVEWAVDMLRFDENRTLDRVAESGGIDNDLAEKLAATVAAMHAQSPVVIAKPWLAAVASFLDQNATAFRETPELFAADAVATLDRGSRDAFERLQPLLAARGELGLVRRGHGDLHLGNIVLIDRQPVPFDAIEFDPMIAAGDGLYDLAFLLMDLVERRLDGAANVVLNGYLAQARRLEHLDGLAALPFFMSLRAAIRAKVTAARLRQADVKDRAGIAESAKTYFALALRLILPPAPKLVAVGGLSGTGKSSVARALAPDVGPVPGAVVVRSDVERKHLFDKDETQRLAPGAYRPEITANVYRVLAEKAGRIVAAGHSVLVDAVFARPDERAAIAAVARSANVPFHGLFLVAGLQTRLHRVGERGPDASDADAAVARRQEEFALGRIDWTKIDASGTLPATLAHARMAL